MRRLLIGVLLLGGCSVGLDEDSGADQDAGASCGSVVSAACLGPIPTDRADVCTYVDRLPFACEDQDADCFPGSCDGQVADDLAGLFDCDDARPDVHPLATELCDTLDNDCDGRSDEQFDVGAECEACGDEGKQECDIDDPTAVACSTEPGQSAAAAPGAERCNGADDDCDGLTDEDCALELDDAPRASPSLCADRIVFLQDGAVWHWSGDGAQEVDPGPAAYPACGEAGVVWLDIAGADCTTPEDGPLRCTPAHLMVDGPDGQRDITGIDALGPPAVANGAVYWHAIVAGQPVVKRTSLAGGGIENPISSGAFSDPTRASAGQVAVRTWQVANAPRVQLRGEDGERDTTLGVWSSPGPPSMSVDWLAFSAGSDARAIWAVPRANPGDAFQIASGALAHPRTDGAWIAWRDAGPPVSLQLFDLETGLAETIALDVPGDGYDLHGGWLVWLAPGPFGDTTLFRRALNTGE